METYHGHVRTPADAIILFEACRLGSLPRVQRRLSEKERQSIKSGSVFVWDEREAGMRRWTDGKSWSASRVSGSFLTYREMEGKRGGSSYGSTTGRPRRTPDSTKGSDSDVEPAGDEGPDGYRYKPDGLMKQSFSITTSTGNHLHLISYYSRQSGAAMQPSQDPALRHIRPPKGMYPESSVNDQTIIPAVTRTPMTTPPMPHVYPAAYPRSGPQMMYGGPPSMTAYPLPPGYLQYPPTSVPTPPQQFSSTPIAYPQPISAAQQATLGSAFQFLQAQSTSSDMLTRSPYTSSTHKRTGSTSSYTSTHMPHQSPHTLPAQISNYSRSNSPSDGLSLSKLDPRLIAPSPLANNQILPALTQDSARSYTRTPSPSLPRRDLSATPTSHDTVLTSSSTIPSIGSLVNGVTEFDARSRSASKSPSSCQRGATIGPQDIPHSKIGFAGEDIRALRVLDRAFKT
ncbi:MAG: hypothetical protein GOMPHAMPRED_001292 [Gomphillus americanus]|uniref:cAMP-independent regulatory protein pac2 n=1 Tax=Gomphillus americanus TaxID=1940652 RepID=A0A8H3F3T4_9LECA|nr:MAG: hypothetical protein GOMPHAMPRED_001292 [Gomphillus americanus]